MAFTNPLKRIIIAIESLDRASTNLAAISTQLTALQASANATTAQLAATSVALDKVAASATRAGPPVASFNKGLIGAAAVARGMFIRIIVLTAAVAALGLATRGTVGAAIDFETSFSRIRKTVDLTEVGFQRLARANRDLAKIIPVNVNELNKIGEIAGQLGIRGVNNIVRFEEAIAKIGVATDLTVEEAAISFAQLAEIFDLNIQQIEFLTNVTVSLGNQFATFESKIVAFGLRIAGIGAALGLTASQILAIGTAFTAVGVPVQRGGTAVQRVLLALNKAANQGGEELDVFLAVLQLTEQQFRDLVKQDPAEAFIRFVEALRNAGDDAIRVLEALGLEDARLVASFFAVAAAGGTLRETFDVATEAEDNLVAVTTEFNRAADITTQKVQLMKNNFNELGITLGTLVLPAFVALSEVAIDVSEKLDLLNGKIELFGVIFFVTLAAVAGAFGLIPLAIVGVIGALTILAFKWDEVFSQLSKPVQVAVVKVAELFDTLINGIITGINKLVGFEILGVNIVKFFTGFGGGTIGFESNIAGALKRIQAAEAARQRALANVAAFGAFNALIIPEELLPQAEFKAPGIPGLPEFLAGLEKATDKTGKAAKKAATELDPLADGIITLFESLKFGIAGSVIPLLELQFAIKEQASATFRTNVEISKLSILMAGQGGLADTAGVLRFSLTTLGESFKKANETVLGFFNRLAQAALNATNDAISKLFSRPTRETAILNKALAELEKERLFLLQGGAIPQEQPELFEAIDRQIAVIENQIRIREAESNILQAQLDLADQTLLTDLELQVAAAVLVTQLEEVSKVADTLAGLFFNETIARQFAIDQIGRFTDALAAATIALGGPTVSFAHGGIGNFGAGTLVNLHGREAILPLEDPRRMAEILSRVGLQSGAGGGAVVQVNTIVDPDITNLRRIIVKEVAEKTDQALRQAGFGGEFVTSGAFAPG